MATDNTQPSGGNSSTTQADGGNGSQTLADGGKSLETLAGDGNSLDSTKKPSEQDYIIHRKAERMAKKLATDLVEKELPARLRALLEEKGLDPDSLDELPKQQEQLERAWKAKVTKLENRATEAETKLTALARERTRERVENIIVSLANGKTSDMQAFLALARAHVDIDEGGKPIVRGEDGEVLDDETPQTWIPKLLTRHPALAAPVGGPGAGSRVGEPQASAKQDYSKMKWDSPEARAYRLKAMREGMP